MRGAWEKRGAKDGATAAQEEAVRILETHKGAELPMDILKELRLIVVKAVKD